MEQTSYTSSKPTVSDASLEDRLEFIRNTYLHLGLAIFAFVGFEYVLFATGIADAFANFVFSYSISWIGILVLFMIVGNVANRWAHSDATPGMQYLGLGLYVLAEAILFIPLLFMAMDYSSPLVIPSAAIITLCVFGGLTLFVFTSKKDFSFLRSGLALATMIAIGLIVVSILFGFDLGIIFSVVMVGLAGGYVLYETSNVLHHYNPEQHVAASLALFAVIALMFWYVLRILMRLNRR
ncbi:MAG: Bax inhibitor-1 family protein [Chloroflexota bacterium]